MVADRVEAQDLGDPLASIGQRIVARLLDWGFLMAIWVPLAGTTSERLEDGSLELQRWAVIGWMIFVVVYEAVMVAWRGQTFGKQAVGIELVSLKGGSRLSLAASVSRVMPVGFAILLLQVFFPIAMVFVYFSAAFMANSRGILDLMAGSVVIEARNSKGLFTP